VRPREDLVKKIGGELKDFLMRGNAVDLAVAVVVGAAFTTVVASFTNDVLMQVVAAIFGKPNFDGLTFEIGKGVIYYGKFLTALINFALIGTVVFFVVKAINTLAPKKEEQLEATEVELLGEIRDLLSTRS
jgi:large conductance mechanosensitive channel